MSVNHDPFVQSLVFDQKQAEQLARLFNLAFNSSLLYGGSHPITLENAGSLHKLLSALLVGKQMLTISIARDSVFIENQCVDKSVNQRRMVAYCKKVDIQSISFEIGVQREEIAFLIRMLGDLQESETVETMKNTLVAQGAKKVRLNYVMYKKVTIDEEIVDKNPAISQKPNANELLQELAPVLSLKKLIENSTGATDGFMSKPHSETEASLAEVSKEIRDLSSDVENGDVGKKFASTAEMMEAVVKLRKDLTQGLTMLKATGRVFAQEQQVEDELGMLSRQTVLRLILDEYKNGSVTVKRLSQIVRRIMPDVKELKSLLPSLKESLLAAGMKLADYVQLVQAIALDMEESGLVDVFSSVSDEMGISVDEVVASIKSDPAEAARLIVLGAEIRRGPHGDDAQLSKLLTDYVERVSQNLAKKSRWGEIVAPRADGKTALKHFEDELLVQLQSHGLQESVMKHVRFELTKKNRGYDLPKGVFDIRATKFFLEHEIKRFLRYNSPFSTIMISCVSLQNEQGEKCVPVAEETSYVISEILKILKKMLRDLDLIGVMGWILENAPFAILPMTDEPGAQCVISRLQGVFGKTEFRYLGRLMLPRIVLTTFEFDKDKTPDCTSYINGVVEHHKKHVDAHQ